MTRSHLFLIAAIPSPSSLLHNYVSEKDLASHPSISALVCLHIFLEPRPWRPNDPPTRSIHLHTFIPQQPHFLPVMFACNAPPARFQSQHSFFEAEKSCVTGKIWVFETALEYCSRDKFRRLKSRVQSRKGMRRKVGHLLPSEATDSSVSSNHPMTRHPRRKRIVPQRIPHRARRGREMVRESEIGRVRARRYLAKSG